ncbi:PleD family two-component system response regulator [Denitratisoma sp. DHT3]|uniref:response regulator n=1 Tax=Denitratisoma sp. DHT3 TaxID=1981880 RepID=UPI001644C759|nr:response regulator [Denitratisoma sp. DHT3]
MNDGQFHICIIDDDEICRMAVVAALQDEGAGFQPAECVSGEECLARYAEGGEALPDLLLLDIEMGGMNGYEVCRRIRAAGHAEVQIMFVSSHNDLDSRLASYDAGGNDFITKPLVPEELVRKVALAMRARKNLLTLRHDLTAAEEMSSLALTSLDEMGSIQKYLRSLLGSHSLESLGKRVIAMLAPYGYDSVAQLRTAHASLTLKQSGPASPLEQSILDQSRSMERIFQFRSRLIVNYERISIFVANMPLQDEVLAGRIRDYVAVVAEAADAAIESIAIRQGIIGQAREVQALTHHSRTAVTMLREQYRHQQLEARRELGLMVENLENEYYKLGLTQDQEQMISDLVRSSTDKVLALFAAGLELEGQFERILDGLNKAGDTVIETDAEEVTTTEVWV